MCNPLKRNYFHMTHSVTVFCIKYCERFFRGSSLIFWGLDVSFCFIFILLLLPVLRHLSFEQRCGEARAASGASPQSALESSHQVLLCRDRWLGPVWGKTRGSRATSPPHSGVSAAWHICPWPQVSLDERMWVTESKHITTPRKAIPDLCPVDGESC